MNTTKNKKPVLEKAVVETAQAKPTYEAPRIARKQSLERVTLASGTFAPGGEIGGN